MSALSRLDWTGSSHPTSLRSTRRCLVSSQYPLLPEKILRSDTFCICGASVGSDNQLTRLSSFAIGIVCDRIVPETTPGMLRRTQICTRVVETS